MMELKSKYLNTVELIKALRIELEDHQKEWDEKVLWSDSFLEQDIHKEEEKKLRDTVEKLETTLRSIRLMVDKATLMEWREEYNQGKHNN